MKFEPIWNQLEASLESLQKIHVKKVHLDLASCGILGEENIATCEVIDTQPEKSSYNILFQYIKYTNCND